MTWCWLIGHHYLPTGKEGMFGDPVLACSRCLKKAVPK